MFYGKSCQTIAFSKEYALYFLLKVHIIVLCNIVYNPIRDINNIILIFYYILVQILGTNIFYK